MFDAVKIDSLFLSVQKMIELPLDTLVEIACRSPASWRAMLAMPSFARWTLTTAGRRRAAERFVETTRIDGMECTLLDGQLHSFWSQPAVVRADGGQEWYHNGRRHRDDGPAIIGADGGQEWYHNGRSHRTDGPALVGADGHQEWYRDDRWHREDGPAVVWADGRQEWWRDGAPYEPDI